MESGENMEKVLISVIVPIYNGANYLKGFVASMKAQTYKNLEIIFVDDGSIDNTVELCTIYIEGDNRFCILQKENGGAASARNYGLLKAQGEYIAFIDVDDYVFPEYINYLYCLIRKHGADMACCEYYRMWESEKIPIFNNEYGELIFNRVEALENLLYKEKLNFYSCTKLYKKAVVEGVKFPEGMVYGEDQIFTLSVINRCNRIAYGNCILYIYWQRLSSVVHSTTDIKQCRRSWNLWHGRILEDIKQDKPELINAVQSLLFMSSIDTCCRIWRMKGDEQYRLKKELLDYIKQVDWSVLKDKKCKRVKRILAFISCINVSIMIMCCRLYMWLGRVMKFGMRHAV